MPVYSSKDTLPRMFPYVCIGSHVFTTFADKKFMGAQGTLTILYRTLRTWLFGCLLALCGSTMHPAQLYMAVSRQFFFLLSVWSVPLLYTK